MKAFALAVLLAVGGGYAAAIVLGGEQKTAYEQFTTTGARVGDAGHNLVGADWPKMTGKGS